MNKIKHCRNCKSVSLESILNLGNQAMTGIFPEKNNSKISSGDLKLVRCLNCSLVQLQHSFDPNEMYGQNYGYRSSLNSSMVNHLLSKSVKLKQRYNLKKNDIILDIGSNDGTFLSFFNKNFNRIGIDPTISKFKKYYDDKTILLVDDFFNSENYYKKIKKKAKLITSLAMFYDLDDPNDFVSNICEVLDDDGIWHFEQSYMPMMIETTSYDTICHEHLEYYDLTIIKKILSKHKLKVIDIELNSINGGSIAITAAKKKSKHKTNEVLINWILNKEKKLYRDENYFFSFRDKVKKHRKDLKKIIRDLNADNKIIIGYGASTKGNVLLQYCGFTSKEIKFIAEINKDKYNHYTPGSNIKIVSEAKAKSIKPDYMLVLPWHFRDSIIRREKKFLENKGKLIFPLPQIEIV
jgi:hypothetical protein